MIDNIPSPAFLFGQLFPLHASVGARGKDIQKESDHNFDTLSIFSSVSTDASSREKDDNTQGQVITTISKQLGLAFFEEEPPEGQVCFAESPEVRDDFKTYFTKLNLLHYVYAVLFSPALLPKTGDLFPDASLSIPISRDATAFFRLVRLGETLRSIHRLNIPPTDELMADFPVVTENTVKNPAYTNRRIYINSGQYFNDVPEAIWSFRINHQSVAERWLLQKTGKQLSVTDIITFRKIITAISKTYRLSTKAGVIVDNIRP